jgi:hypothetical protein
LASIKTEMLRLASMEHRLASEKTLNSLIELIRFAREHSNNLLLPSRRCLLINGYEMYFKLLDADPVPSIRKVALSP